MYNGRSTENRTQIDRLKAGCNKPLYYTPVGADGQIRTDTLRILSPLTLPIGLHPHYF